MSVNQTFSFLATCARGFESFLESELRSLGIVNTQVSNGGVVFDAHLKDAMKLCLWSRLANKVEVLVGECYAPNEEAIYELGRRIPLDPWFSADRTFCIHAHVNDQKFKNGVFLSLKLKDGLVDHMREAWGQRASIDTQRPDIVLGLQVIQRKARVFVELQGDPLNMRGYRRRQLQAPIRETLAASMIAMSGWTPEKGIFIDPMCGSGTFAIEAALMATRTAPGIQRHFAFERLPFFKEIEADWKSLREEAREISRQARKGIELDIRALDIDDEALDIAQNNAQTAGVADYIDFRRGDILRLKPVPASIVTNPPYGERITVDDFELPEFYFQLGRLLRTFQDASLTIISTSELLKKNMHMKPMQRISTYNGPIPCEAAHYLLGGRRTERESL